MTTPFQALENVQIILAAEPCLDILKDGGSRILDDREYVGGFLSLYDPATCIGDAFFQIAVGNIDPDKAQMYRKLSIEKPMRARQGSSQTSYINHDPAKKQYGGGFYFHNCDRPSGIGFSGLPEEYDAVLCLLILMRVGILNYRQAHALAQECDDYAINSGVPGLLSSLRELNFI